MADSMFDHLAKSMSSKEDAGVCSPIGDYLDQRAKDEAREESGTPMQFDPEDWERAYRKRRRFQEMTGPGGSTFNFEKMRR